MIVNLEIKIPHQSDLIQEMILVKQLFQRKQFKPAWTHFLKKWKWNLLEFTSDSTLNLFCYGHYFFSYNDVIENILISNVWLNKKKENARYLNLYSFSTTKYDLWYKFSRFWANQVLQTETWKTIDVVFLLFIIHLFDIPFPAKSIFLYH